MRRAARTSTGAAFLVAAMAACGHADEGEPSPAPAKSTGEAVAAASGACGSDGLPDCPLQAWMKSNGTQAVLHQDFDRLRATFARLAPMAPSDYPSWSSFAKDGEAAAKAHDLDAVRRACKRCHDTYRAEYRRAYRHRPAP